MVTLRAEWAQLGGAGRNAAWPGHKPGRNWPFGVESQ